MAQRLDNEFTEIDFTDDEQDAIFASFSDRQLQVLQNYRAAAARYNIARIFSEEKDVQKELREHAYQLGRMEVVGEIVSEVAAARLRISQREEFLQNASKG